MCTECVRMISMNSTVIEKLNESVNDNAFYMKRDDLLPFSFGGNKARKALKFKEDIIENILKNYSFYTGDQFILYYKIIFLNQIRYYKITLLDGEIIGFQYLEDLTDIIDFTHLALGVYPKKDATDSWPSNNNSSNENNNNNNKNDNYKDDNTLDPLDFIFPCEESLIQPIIDLCIKEIAAINGIPRDAVNNATDDLSLPKQQN